MTGEKIMSDSNDQNDLLSTFAIGAALLMLVDIGHTAYTNFVDRDKVKAKQLEFVRELKENGYDILGLIAEKTSNGLDSIGNALDAAPLSQFLKDKITLAEAASKLQAGDHIAVLRTKLLVGRYTHHGIYSGNRRVIEYGTDNLSPSSGVVREISLRKFVGSSGLLMEVNSDRIYSPAEVLRRARKKIGERQYHLLFNNCENFARWCRGGDAAV